MEKALQITFRNLDRSDALEADLRRHAEKLEQICDSIIGCKVAVEARQRHHQHGNHYRVRVDVTLSGAEIVAGRDPDEHHAHTDVYVAIRDAFDHARRQLEDFVRRRGRRRKASGKE